MILLDTGPIIALIVRSDRDHFACAEQFKVPGRRFITTGPVLTETLYLLGKMGGWPAQEAAWKLVERGMVEIAPAAAESWMAMRRLMEKYRDVPMDLADASLVALANDRGLQDVMTLDSDFEVYRLNGKRPFRMLP